MPADSTEPIRVLLIEDDEDDFVLTRELLDASSRTRFDLSWAATYDEAVSAVARRQHDVYLVDYRLGRRDGLDLLRHVRALGITAPMILLTGATADDIDLAAMEAGAADYLVKGSIDTQLLERSIRYALQQNRTLQALRESEDRYALSARGANDGLWVWDLEHGVVYFSERWKAMLGYEDHEIGSSPDEWFSRVHTDDVALLKNALDLHGSELTPHFEAEYRMLCSDGVYRWMLSRGMAVRDGNGVTRMAGSQTDVTERKLAVERLMHDAFHDTLTGLPNRALFVDRLQHVVERSQRDGSKPFAVLFLDLDRFKNVNDSLGHAAGDELLVSVAHRLKQTVRSSDTVARLGGDEFAILLDAIDDATTAVRMAQRIHEAMNAPYEAGGLEIVATVSIGIAVGGSHYAMPQEILRDADLAMYRAKARGKARHEVFDAAMHERALSRLQLESDLRRAVDRGELRLHYQPIISLSSGVVAGFEALIRWKRGEEEVPASEIISIAEETGMIITIGQWVLCEALRQLKEWQQEAPGAALDMHVNVSPTQLFQSNFVQRVTNALDRSGVEPRHVHLEVTENVLIENADAAASLLRQLRDLGVGISLDDFGVGYASLSSLLQFPFSVLKIDRSFLLHRDHNRSDEIVQTIGRLARILGIGVTVEGLESEEQVARMRDLGLDFAQGFYYSKAIPPEEARELIAMAGRGRWELRGPAGDAASC